MRIILFVTFLMFSSLSMAQCVQDVIAPSCDTITVTDENGDASVLDRRIIFKGVADKETLITIRQREIDEAKVALKRFNILKDKMESCLKNQSENITP